MDVLLEIGQSPQAIVEPYVCGDVCLIPVLGVLPTLRYHTLRGKIDDIVGTELLDSPDHSVGVVIEISLVESEMLLQIIGNPSVGKKSGMGRWGTAHPYDFGPLLQSIADKTGPGE